MLFNSFISVILSFFTAFSIVFTAIPTIVFVADAKKLYDEPGIRKSHKRSVATLGGIALFSGITIGAGLFTRFSVHPEFQFIFVASIVLFFVGLKDDILIIAPLKKLSGQVFGALIIVVLGNLRFTHLHTFLGVNQLLYVHSFLLTVFVLVVIINSFNLIDGIDGLASGVGIVSALFFGTFFYINGEVGYAVLSAAMAGSLIAFFWFNVFGTENKIFMGDTGSLLVGLFLAVLVIRFNEMNITQTSVWHIHSAPAVSFGILFIPLFDTIRVFTIRVLRGKSPFQADKNHVHHRLLALGYSHLKSTLILLSVNVGIIAFVLVFNFLGILLLTSILLVLGAIFSLLPEMIYKKREKKKLLKRN
jgi:UDP-GlcNAc:undecaprenyl-phosphate GlcNAc-1-phosphate transferase